jgi:23S rRNA pseudouridine2605 synthase
MDTSCQFLNIISVPGIKKTLLACFKLILNLNKLEKSEDEAYRIGKFLAHAGLCSRREAAEFLELNEVFYENNRVTDLSFKVPVNATLNINKKPVSLEKSQVVLLNKPRGYVCTHKEQKNQKSIFRLLSPEMKSFFFAGRLDEDSRGLVVLSNNGDLIFNLTHPKTETTKIYHVHSTRPLSNAELEKITRGIWSKGEKLMVDSIKPLKETAKYEIHLHEGKNREIRRIFEALGLTLNDLLRIKIDIYTLEGIPEGSFKIL